MAASIFKRRPTAPSSDLKRLSETETAMSQSSFNVEKITDIQNRFTGGEILLVPGRIFIREGALWKICRKGPKKRQFFLFNDVLVYGSIISRGYCNQHILPISSMTVTASCHYMPQVELEDTDDVNQDMELDPENAFQINHTDKSFHVFAQNKADKTNWISNLSKQINKLNKNTEGGTLLYKAVWVPDSVSKQCMLCKQKFTAFVRKHHCRMCGRLICSQCSPHKSDIAQLSGAAPSGKLDRVCIQCNKPLILTKSSDQVLANDVTEKPLKVKPNSSPEEEEEQERDINSSSTETEDSDDSDPPVPPPRRKRQTKLQPQSQQENMPSAAARSKQPPPPRPAPPKTSVGNSLKKAPPRPAAPPKMASKDEEKFIESKSETKLIKDASSAIEEEEKGGVNRPVPVPRQQVTSSSQRKEEPVAEATKDELQARPVIVKRTKLIQQITNETVREEATELMLPSEDPPTETLPPEDPPTETLPPEDPPTETLPPEDPPTETLPPEDPPTETLPLENLPSETLPPEDLPPEDPPTETLPPDSMPAEVPSETPPTETLLPTSGTPPTKKGLHRKNKYQTNDTTVASEESSSLPSSVPATAAAGGRSPSVNARPRKSKFATPST